MPASDQSYLAAVPFLLVAVMYPLVALQRHRSPRIRGRALTRFARRVGLPVPDHLRERIDQQLAAYRLGADLGGAAGLALASVWGLTLGRAVVGSAGWTLIVVASTLAGCAMGAAFATVRRSTRRPTGAARIARPTTTSLADYVAPVELQGGRGVALLPTALLGLVTAAAVAGVASSPRPVLVALAVAGLAALAFGELAGRRVLDAPQPAGSDLELIWDDAVRAHTLRAVVTVPLTVGTYASVAIVALLGDLGIPLGSAPVAVLASGAVALAVAVAAVLVWSAGGRPHRYFRDQLWPEHPLLVTSGGRSRP